MSEPAKPPDSRDAPKPGAGRLAALVRRATRALVLERLWPPLVWAACVAILFLAASWLGLWLVAPRGARIAGLALFALAGLAALAPLARLRRPAAAEALRRLDRDAGLPHRPASSLADDLANAGDSPETQALWALHQRRLAERLRTVAVAPPAPRMPARDFYALRFAVALAAIAAGLLAGPERYGRVVAAFDWRSDAAIAAANRVDAWIDPPPFTGRPPIVVEIKAGAPAQTFSTPEESTLVVRGDPEVVKTRIEGALEATKSEGKAGAPGPQDQRWTIRGDGKATILRDGSPAATLVISAIPAGTPTIELTGEPQANASGSMTLAYRLADRYGVAGAKVDFALPTPPGAAAPPRSLIEAPQAALQLPASPSGVGDARSTLDLSEHPWAGANVLMTLSATGVSGKTGRSPPIAVTLPQRAFHSPLARALVEQRRHLVLDPDHEPKRVAVALTGLTIAPDVFDTSASVYLGLKTARSSVDHARGDADLIEVAALLWSMALQIEDGDAPQALRDLRAAEQALREALKRGASDEEIRKLTKEMREAAERFMREMARKSDPQQDADSQPMREQDLDSLMDRMEDTARNGARDDAEAMLDQLQDMFENMQSAREAGESPAGREMRKTMGALDKLMRDQQALRDDTFRRDQRERARRASPDGQQEADRPGDQQQDMGDGSSLSERQKALKDRLRELQRKLKGLGMKGEKGMDDAEGAMGEAQGDLESEAQQGKDGQGGASGRGRTPKGDAVDAQGRALQAMREAAQGLAQQMQGEGRGNSYSARGRGQTGRRPGDPLGRQSEGQFGAREGLLKDAVGAAERARRVMEELRRRLADPSRPADERDYLERLLKRD